MWKLIGRYALRLCALLLFVGGADFVNTAFAQGAQTEKQLAVIRKLYTQVNERITAGLEDKVTGLHHAMVSVGGDKDGQQWRAVGTMEDRTEFYFDCEPGHPEGCNPDPRKLVVKIVTNYRGAADLISRAEYLFNPQGELVFALTSDNTMSTDGETIERRYYFAGGRLILVMRGERAVAGNFNAADRAGAREVQRRTVKLRNLFAQLF